MEEIRIDNDKLNKAIEKNLPEVPRSADGKIDIDKITLEVDEKGNRIIENDIFDCYYKELPEKVINKDKTWRTTPTGGKIKILGNDPGDREIQRKGAETLNATFAQRRKMSETIDILLRKKATPEEIEALGLEDGATKQDALIASMLLKAIERGDVQAGAFIRDTAGEKPTEKIAAEVETITAEDRAHIERILNRTKAQDIVSSNDPEG